jgi:hypothetical protein
VLHVQVAQPVLAQVREVLLVQVVPHVQVALLAQQVLVLVAHVQVVPQVSAPQALVLRVVAQVQPVAVVAVQVPQVRSERVALRTRAVSPSALREKNSSRDLHRASVVQWCHAATVTPLFVSAAELRFRTSQTRLALTQVS